MTDELDDLQRVLSRFDRAATPADAQLTTHEIDIRERIKIGELSVRTRTEAPRSRRRWAPLVVPGVLVAASVLGFLVFSPVSESPIPALSPTPTWTPRYTPLPPSPIPAPTPTERDLSVCDARTLAVIHYERVNSYTDEMLLSGDFIDHGPNKYANGTVELNDEGKPTYYTVASGDTRYGIGERFCIDELSLYSYIIRRYTSLQADDTITLRPGPGETYIPGRFASPSDAWGDNAPHATRQLYQAFVAAGFVVDGERATLPLPYGYFWPDWAHSTAEAHGSPDRAWARWMAVHAYAAERGDADAAAMLAQFAVPLGAFDPQITELINARDYTGLFDYLAIMFQDGFYWPEWTQ